MRRVGTGDRLRDVLAILLLVGGVALYLRASAGMRAMADGRLTPPPGRTHLAETDRQMTMSRLGLALAVAGLGVGIWSFVSHRASNAPPK